MEEKIRSILEKHVYDGPGYVDIIVYVKPEQRESKLVLEGDDLVFHTVEPDVAGRPNADLVRYLAQLLNIPTSRVEVVYGTRDTTKRVRIYEVDRDTVIEALVKVLASSEESS
ncbi:DUF167 domain-containing protein [Pyrolobus fumarii]|nr:DUF167 domain-containing protein [Pyrolobus fumarii]